jgi:hypothetical protein
LGFIYGGRIQIVAYHIVVHEYEATTKYEELLDERGFGFPLPYHIQNHVSGPLHGFDKMFSYY